MPLACVGVASCDCARALCQFARDRNVSCNLTVRNFALESLCSQTFETRR